MSVVPMTITTAELNSYFTKIALLLCIILLTCIVFIWRTKANRANSYFVYTISVVCIFVAFYLGMLGGTLADELNVSGNILPELSVIMLSIIIIFFTLWKSAKDRQA